MKKIEDLKRELVKLSTDFNKVSYLFEVVEFEEGKDINDYIVDKYPFEESFDELNCEVMEWVELVVEKLGSDYRELKKSDKPQVSIEGLKDSLTDLSKSFCKVSYLFETVEFEDGKDINDYIVEKYPFGKSFDELNVEVMEWVEEVIEKIENK